ncbi:MAG: amino acid permease [Planctomycetota bacterium]|nr:amino acid permease [Planctomycetota bacterium]
MSDSKTLSKKLGLFDVFAITTGATLSGGLFLLPGPAAAQAGPAIVLCYMLVAIPLLPAMLCIAELSTAMPRAGGSYFFLDRSLGPLAGTVGGMGTWLTMVLKTAFALVGLGAYISLFMPSSGWALKGLAIAFALLFGWINILGAEKAGGFQRILVIGLLVILTLFVMAGLPRIEPVRFEGMFETGSQDLLATTGLVYISFISVTKVASVAEEVRDPERNLTLGLFIGIGVCMLIYLCCTLVMVGVLPLEELSASITPMGDAAKVLLGTPGMAIVAGAALLAFFSVSNAGIMAASRYPLAMGRDDLLPDWFARVNSKGTPIQGVVITVVVVVAVILLLDPLSIAKLASTFQMLLFSALCLAVIVMRESGLKSYDPGYKVPLYPALPIFGVLAPFGLIGQMGAMSTLFSLALIGAGIAWYLSYAKGRVDRRGALFHVFARLGEQRSEELDVELRSILKEKGLRDGDPLDEIVLGAAFVESASGDTFESIVERCAAKLAKATGRDAELFVQGFTEGTKTGATPVAKGVALPHMRMAGIDEPYLVLVRCRKKLNILAGDVFGKTTLSAPVHAIFFLVSPENDPSKHLRFLAHLATRIDRDDFEAAWLGAKSAVQLREIFLRNERYISVEIKSGTPAQDWATRTIQELGMPEGCLVAAIQRGRNTMVPRGSTVLETGDRLLIIGDPETISGLYAIHEN